MYGQPAVGMGAEFIPPSFVHESRACCLPNTPLGLTRHSAPSSRAVARGQDRSLGHWCGGTQLPVGPSPRTTSASQTVTLRPAHGWPGPAQLLAQQLRACTVYLGDVCQTRTGSSLEPAVPEHLLGCRRAPAVAKPCSKLTGPTGSSTLL